MKTGLIACISLAISLSAQATVPTKASEPFRWGAASAAYQIEGATQVDNRGPSVWDVYLDDHSLAGPGVSGATAINFYDRRQYLKDIALMKSLGFTSYRFSISWTRLLPDGLGPVNPLAVNHYRQFINDLKAAGIQPMLTLYHWDMPASLARDGGWANRKSVAWFQRYAEVVFANFADQVDLFVLVNEPSVERATQVMAEERLNGQPGDLAIVPSAAHLGEALKVFNHILLASAAAKESFTAHGYKGRLGLALPLFPILTAENASSSDEQDAKSADGVLNRWFLDAIYKGTYPADVLKLADTMHLDIDVQAGDAKRVGAAEFDYLGVNYYSPLFISHKTGAEGYAPKMWLPEGALAAFNGAVRPDQFKALLDRIRVEYGNPPVFITENGAGFPGEDVLVNGEVRDENRCRYIVDHVAAMVEAMKAGADVRGYHVWSSHDNLEWLSGYGSRFGLIYVDFDTQKRTPKNSALVYARLVKGDPVTSKDCDSPVSSAQKIN
ncbi:glycoside hydrolase family 1 protein [Pseudomonas sp. MHK4]|jgi:beta-glucosidase